MASKDIVRRARIAMVAQRTQSVVVVGVALVVALGVYWSSSRRKNSGGASSSSGGGGGGGGGGGERSQAGDRVPCDVLTSDLWRPRLESLTELSLAKCGLRSLSPNIRYCVNLAKLDLAHNDLETLPEELAVLPKLEILFVLGSRRLRKMPEVLGRLKRVTRLGLRSNGIETVTAAGTPPLVEHLILTDNKISEIEDGAYAKFGRVRKLMLANNRLERFTGGPTPRDNLRSLELLRLANNDLRGLPTSVLRLPRLAWLAIAGNPRLVAAPDFSRSLPRASWDDLGKAGDALGSGASGVVRSASWGGRDVAVKRLLDKSSDGRARDEVASVDALFADEAEPPPSLVRTLGVVEPDDGSRPTALIMELLPRGVRDLAKPPTIVEVTRDRYADSERFSPRFVLMVARDVASALARLHEKRVCHGDVYSHNTLVEDTTNTVKLGDLGASFVYANYAHPADAHLFELIEVRAFGIQLAELATRIAFDTPDRLKPRLLNLAEACLQEDPDLRPRFRSIQSTLSTLDPRAH
ncbi:hypothetical protein CTAYLR_001854 [Chrysophaeum taylorii]|uniref:Protein kinase domain-containing protein n=1 Tax=Chrysophaeum taylorii TaxID=2483200 RepID=A0AAD7XG48_9STRA|nr:hypothetical protein CTAYLR_001854 [Chrysophaeum taylorii]